MNLWQLISVGILGIIMSHIVKQVQPAFALYVSLAASLMLMIAAVSYIKPALEFAYEIAAGSRLYDVGLIMLRICAIGVTTSFASDICNDTGEAAIGGRIVLLGKCAIVLTVLPVLKLIITSAEKFLM